MKGCWSAVRSRETEPQAEPFIWRVLLRIPLSIVFLALAALSPLAGQERLSLREAVQLAIKQNKGLQASHASVDVAETGVRQARSSMLPKLTYSESVARSNNPVFVFGSLLTQHQFTQGNFDIYSLNRPGFLDNFQSTVSAEQVLFDAGQTRKAVRSAKLERQMAGEDDRQSRTQITLSAIQTYLDVALSREALGAANQAVRSAQADMERAMQVRTAGMSTDADVLSIRVHLSRVREQQIRREADLATAEAALNDALGLPLDAVHELTTPLSEVKRPSLSLQQLESTAVTGRPEQRRANLAVNVASTQVDLARSSFWPRISVRGTFESDRQQFANRGGANWLGSVSLTWNVLNGGADKARLDGANQSLLRAQAERDRLASSVRLGVRRAWEDLRATEQQVDVAKATVADAEESLRITQNRYQAGMSTVTDLLRTEVAVADSRIRYLAALHDQHLAVALIELATGTLSVDSLAVNE